MSTAADRRPGAAWGRCRRPGLDHKSARQLDLLRGPALAYRECGASGTAPNSAIGPR
jgi:hypothetical protein